MSVRGHSCIVAILIAVALSGGAAPATASSDACRQIIEVDEYGRVTSPCAAVAPAPMTADAIIALVRAGHRGTDPRGFDGRTQRVKRSRPDERR